MILHHYDASPFSEKIRLMLGYCSMEWHSLVAPPMPPRANLDQLTGGYRRIPVAQIGADIFCDTAIISEEIALLNNKPRLSVIGGSDQIKQFVNYTDSQVFIALLGQMSGRETLNMLLRNMSTWEAIKFVKDRMGMATSSSVTYPPRRERKEVVSAFYNEIESELGRHKFIFGNEPSAADFSAYHPLWFRFSRSGHQQFQDWPNINSWFNNMSNFGHGFRNDITPQFAFDAASGSMPRELPKSSVVDKKIGKKVTIGPADYAKDKVEGILVASTKSRWILKRTSEELGDLHVHFPRAGYELQALNPANN